MHVHTYIHIETYIQAIQRTPSSHTMRAFWDDFSKHNDDVAIAGDHHDYSADAAVPSGYGYESQVSMWLYVAYVCVCVCMCGASMITTTTLRMPLCPQAMDMRTK